MGHDGKRRFAVCRSARTQGQKNTLSLKLITHKLANWCVFNVCVLDPSCFCEIWALRVSWFTCYKKHSLPPTPSKIIQIWQMENCTEFGDSYLFQTFVNKKNTKLLNYRWVVCIYIYIYIYIHIYMVIAEISDLSIFHLMVI